MKKHKAFKVETANIIFLDIMFHIYVKVQLPDQLNSFVWNGFFFMSVSFRGCVDT